MRRAITPQDQAWLDLKGPGYVPTLSDFLALPGVRRLVTLVHDVDDALLAVVVATGTDALLVTAGIVPRFGQDGAADVVGRDGTPWLKYARQAGVKWAPNIALVSCLPDPCWLPCPKCGGLALAAQADWLRTTVKKARTSKPQRVALVAGVITA